MKKVILFCMLLLIPISIVNADNKETTSIVYNTKQVVTLDNCDSLDQIWLNKDSKVLRVGLLAYDTGDTSINKEIQEYACNKLKNAKKIEIEYDRNNTEKDKYHRDMVWVYVDDKLLQEDLLSNGYGMVNYVKNDYSYINNLCSKEANAIKDKKGIWTLGVEEKYCDSGIILEKQEKEANNINTSKKINTETIIKMIMIFLAIIVLGLFVFVKVKHEEKR